MAENNINSEEEVKNAANALVDKIKALVKEGNATYIRIRKNNMVILNLPMTVGVVGTILGVAAAPWAIIIATITAVGLNCTIEVEKSDGSVTLLHGKET